MFRNTMQPVEQFTRLYKRGDLTYLSWTTSVEYLAIEYEHPPSLVPLGKSSDWR